MSYKKKNNTYHRTLFPSIGFRGSTRTLDKKMARNRDVVIFSNGTFKGNLRETFKF